MKVFYFQNWQEALAGEPNGDAYAITIRWYLSYLRQTGEGATLESARRFIEDAIADKRPGEWVAQRWKDALNWFFRHAPVRREAAELTDGRRRHAVTVREYQQSVGREPLIEEAVRLMRIRQMSYRTEESYIGWLRRLGHYHADVPMNELSEEHIKGFLSHLAVEEGVSAATQKQALNACVFLLREVQRRELGDFSDYVQANPRKYYPVVYSREELKRLFEKLEGTAAMMARLQYGCGLRIAENQSRAGHRSDRPARSNPLATGARAASRGDVCAAQPQPRSEHRPTEPAAPVLPCVRLRGRLRRGKPHGSQAHAGSDPHGLQRPRGAGPWGLRQL
jgi:hypothetical protein